MQMKSFRCVLGLNALLLALFHGNSVSQPFQRTSCQPGFYCPLGSFTPIPCPKGTYGPLAGAVSIVSCLKCPPHHYCPRAGLPTPLPCGPEAQQPLTGQESCVCPGEGQTFQTSDGQCLCTIDYQLHSNGESCVHKLYDVCRDGERRTQYGDCLDKYEWFLHCRQQVCDSAEDYRGYDVELGLCICEEPPGRAACGGLCSRRPATELKLQCQYDEETELVWSYEGHVSVISGSVLEMVFKHWDLQGALQCNVHPNLSRPVYTVQTTDAGFLGLLSGLPKQLHQLFPTSTQQGTPSPSESNSDIPLAKAGNISLGGGEMMSSSRRADEGDVEEEVRGITGVLNPTACLHLGDVVLFTVDTHHYPQYDLDNLFNTDSDFDWGAFRQLKEELTLSWTPPGFFSVVFSQPGVYVFTLSSHQHKHLYVRVMPAGGQCYEPGPFFPTTARHVTRVGISQRRNLLLRPDWLVTGGLLFGAVVILCLCVTLLIVFREYGWPEKEPMRVQYRLLQLAYHMEDYSSKGSRVMSLQKIHRNQQARITQDSIQPEACPDTLEEFWDYEHQVDLEAFSSSTFYSLLLKQSQSVTSQLERLTNEVKVLYQGVFGKLHPLNPRLITREKRGEGYERIRKEVEKEVSRRKALASQLRTLLESQLEALRREQQAQQRVNSMFTAQLRESTRLLSKVYTSNRPSCELHLQILIQRLTCLVDEMAELVSTECQRQGAWGLLSEGTGAKLLCPDTGTVLTKGHIFGPDGSLRACQALHCDSTTGLIRPNAHSHMLLSSGHTMAVPPDFFLHPQTCRVMPIAGNVAYDPASSALMFTTDSCTDNRKWDSPLLPFIPYPTSRHSDQPLPSTRIRGLKPGQRLHLGAPMADPDTGVPVPILAVTIHPKTGLVYPLGGVYACPLTHLPQPIQIGYPMLDPRTGNVVLTVGVSLDPVTGAVLPVGGVLLAEPIIEPLSGRMVRVGGASMRGGQLVPHAGGYQALLDSKVLIAMSKTLELLRPLPGQWGSDQTLQHHQGTDRGSGRCGHLISAGKELLHARERSLHCQLQLQTRLEILLDWAVGLQQHGGTLGEMPLPGSDVCVPALLGMQYPDPMGSGLYVPLLGCQTDLVSGIITPLAGTMEDPGGKGLVSICYGSLTADPVTGVVAPVVGARLDVSRNIVVPVTASYWLTVADQTDSVQVEALQREACVRNTHWQQQRQREEDLLSDLDSALFQCLLTVPEANSYQWPGRQLREAAMELQDSAQTEAQRRAAQRSHLAPILPPQVLHILTLADGEEWDQQCVWHSELLLSLEKVDASLEQLHKYQEKWMPQGGDCATTLQTMDKELRQREMLDQCLSTQAEMEAAINALHFARHLSQLCADTAQAVQSGNFWYKEYGLVQCSVHRPSVKVTGLIQQTALPLLERLHQLLEDKQPSSFFSNNQPVSAPDRGLSTKQPYGLETSSRAWTASVPVVKVTEGVSSQSLREPANLAQSQDTGLQASSAPTQHSYRHAASSGIHSHETQLMKECAQPTHMSIPVIPEEEWTRLLELSPLFQLLKEVQLQLKGWACGAGPLRAAPTEEGQSFMDVLDAQWECEGDLIPLDPSVLNAGEFLVYQHGLFLIDTMNNLKLTPSISLQIAAALPNNNYFNNAFRNSFFYQEAEETLFVRRQRLQSVGGFSLLLLHCLTHIKVKDMSSDRGPAFQRLFFKILQECLGELFQARLGVPPFGQQASLCGLLQDRDASAGDLKGTLPDSAAASLLHRLHKPTRDVILELDNKQSHIACLFFFLCEDSTRKSLKKEKLNGSTERHLCSLVMKC